MADELCKRNSKNLPGNATTFCNFCIVQCVVRQILSFHVSSSVLKLKWICEKQDQRAWNGEEQVAEFWKYANELSGSLTFGEFIE